MNNITSKKSKHHCCHHRKKKAECCQFETTTPFEDDDGMEDDTIDTTVRSMHPTATIPGKPSQYQIVNQITERVGLKNFTNDPNGVTYFKPSDWITWDGTTTYNPCTLTKAQLVDAVFPKPKRIMRGLKELFYSINPFQDNANPTVEEIENWNLEVIKHFRRLLGKNAPVVNDKATFLKAAWAEERARTNYWDSNYPGILNSSYGPCQLPFSPNSHCGASFLPSPQDQQPYLDAGMQPITGGGAEAIITINADIPWVLKMSNMIGAFLQQDGIGGHTGPFIGRPKYGSAWYLTGTSVVVRHKWTGTEIKPCP